MAACRLVAFANGPEGYIKEFNAAGVTSVLLRAFGWMEVANYSLSGAAQTIRYYINPASEAGAVAAVDADTEWDIELHRGNGFIDLGTFGLDDPPQGNTGVSASFALIEAQDLAALSTALNAAFAATEAQDTATFYTTIFASFAATEAPDVAALVASTTLGAALAATEAADSGAFGFATSPAAAISVVEAADAAALSIEAATSAVLAAIETADVASFDIEATTSVALAAAEAPDLVTFEADIAANFSTVLGASEAPDRSRFRLRCKAMWAARPQTPAPWTPPAPGTAAWIALSIPRFTVWTPIDG